MTYLGTVKNGRVELPAGTALADGTIVRVVPVGEANAVDPVYRLDELAVDADLPTDLASQHDHYIRTAWRGEN